MSEQCSDARMCVDCDERGVCPTEGLHDYIAANADEIAKFRDSAANFAIGICEKSARNNPILLFCMNEMLSLVAHTTIYGFIKGRTYSEVPKAFEDR